MRKSTLAVGAAALAALVTVGACSNAGNTGSGQSTTSTSTSTSTSANEDHNQADAMFAQQMIPHHQQAVEMSDMLLGKQGIDPRVLDLAKQIKAAQSPEIEQMQTWLTQWGIPTMPGMDMPGRSGMPTASMTPGETGAPTESRMPGMPGMSDMPGMPDESATPGQGGAPSQSTMPGLPGMSGMPGMTGMDGMMSEEDMAALQNAQGVAAAKLYLTQMIKHHEGAINMAQNEISSGKYPAAIALAQSIVTSQQQEIDVMNRILASL